MKIILLALLSISCSMQLYAQSIVLINEQPGTQYNFYYSDDAGGDGHPVTVASANTTIVTAKPVLLIEADNLQTYYLIYPGDTITLNKGANNISILRRINQKYGAADNAELSFFSRLIEGTGKLRVFICPQGALPVGLGEREAFIGKLYNSRMAFLEEYAGKYKLTDAFKKYCAELFGALHVKDLLSLCRSEMVDKDLKEYYIGRVDSLKGFLKLEAGNIWFNAEQQLALRVMKNLVLPDAKSSNYMVISDVIKTNFQGYARDFLLSNTLGYLLKHSIVPQPTGKIWYEKYLTQAESPFYKAAVKAAYEVYLSKGKAALSATTVLSNLKSGTSVAWQDLLKANVGKVIYIDFWASWCAPCKAEMPASLQLKKLYKDKAVKFIYLSLDEKIQDWKDGSADIGLPATESYLVQGAFDAKLPRELKLTSIPRYLLIDKKGNMVSADALRPSEKGLTTQINRLLNQ